MSNASSDDVMDIDTIVETFRTTPYDVLPVEAIRAAQRQAEAITPRLVEVLREAANQQRSGKMPEGSAHLYALYLLAEFRAAELLPAFLEILSLPGEAPYELLGDSITEDTARILAVLVDERAEVLDEMIRNPDLDMFVRWEAAQTFPYLARDGKMSREAAAARLEEHLRWACDQRDGDAATGLVCELDSLIVPSSLPVIEGAFQARLVDESLISLKEIQADFKKGEAEYQERLEFSRPSGIADTVEELGKWATFGDHGKGFSRGDADDAEDDADDDEYDDEDDDEDDTFFRDNGFTREQAIVPYPDAPPHEGPFGRIRNETKRVGRNEKCPCGSGKKYKKCCGRS